MESKTKDRILTNEEIETLITDCVESLTYSYFSITSSGNAFIDPKSETEMIEKKKKIAKDTFLKFLKRENCIVKKCENALFNNLIFPSFASEKIQIKASLEMKGKKFSKEKEEKIKNYFLEKNKKEKLFPIRFPIDCSDIFLVIQLFKENKLKFNALKNNGIKISKSLICKEYFTSRNFQKIFEDENIFAYLEKDDILELLKSKIKISNNNSEKILKNFREYFSGGKKINIDAFSDLFCSSLNKEKISKEFKDFILSNYSWNEIATKSFSKKLIVEYYKKGDLDAEKIFFFDPIYATNSVHNAIRKFSFSELEDSIRRISLYDIDKNTLKKRLFDSTPTIATILKTISNKKEKISFSIEWIIEFLKKINVIVFRNVNEISSFCKKVSSDLIKKENIKQFLLNPDFVKNIAKNLSGDDLNDLFYKFVKVSSNEEIEQFTKLMGNLSRFLLFKREMKDKILELINYFTSKDIDFSSFFIYDINEELTQEDKKKLTDNALLNSKSISISILDCISRGNAFTEDAIEAERIERSMKNEIVKILDLIYDLKKDGLLESKILEFLL